jgi:hypothetical protein
MTSVLVIGGLAAALAAFFRLGRPGNSEHPKMLQVAPGISIEVVETIAPDSEFLCSKCYKTYPVANVHVVPTYNDSLRRYVGSYRCNDDWKTAITETRLRFLSHKSDDEALDILEVFVNRGVSSSELRRFAAGKGSDQAVLSALDALTNGELTLKP